MLLTSLSSMIGAILVPNEYLWLYSTHIILVCLYLIRTKRVLVLFLTLISLFAVWFSETPASHNVTLSEQDRYFINLHQQTLLILTNDNRLPDQEFSKSVAVRLHFPQLLGDINNRDKKSTAKLAEDNLLFNDINLVYSTHIPNHYYEVSLMRYALADRYGAWWLKQLYIERQAALLDLAVKENIDLPFSLRRSVMESLDNSLQQFASWRFSKALLFGQDDDWSQRDLWVVRTLGLAHLFVVSGLHAGFMFLIGVLVAKTLWQLLPARLLLSGLTRHHVELLCIFPLLILYGYLTQWGEPVIRATIMLTLYLLSRCLQMRCSALQILALTLWIVLLINPRQILSPGLWLSFSMVYLLIGFYSIARFKWRRLLASQLMLSTASMVLILGWQEAISVTSIVINLVLIPFAAMVWFPFGLLASLEVLLLSNDRLYAVLERMLKPLWDFLERLVFELPLLFFAPSYSLITKWLLLMTLMFWVFQSPLRRGWLALVCIWCVLFYGEMGWQNTADVLIAHGNGGWFIEKNHERLALKELDESQRQLFLDGYHVAKDNTLLLMAERDQSYSAKHLLAHDVDWLIVPTELVSEQQDLWTGLSINWLDIDQNESLFLYFEETRLRVKHSRCQYAFFLFKSDTCMRVEKLESMLN
ncbi:ComEC/Rec2 family competence protein [Marinomonas sp. THO17]|uniref:ComEC/Rec2 family competence protein n=1 Tax=Marinomonas sp. THO17 TaxID=3149048 RepID=UPI00336BFF4C